MENFQQRLLSIIKALGFKNPTEFGRAPQWGGKDYQSKISRYTRNEGGTPNHDFYYELAQSFPRVNLTYLIIGKGKPLLDEGQYNLQALQSLLDSKTKQIKALQEQVGALQEENLTLSKMLENQKMKKK